MIEILATAGAALLPVLSDGIRGIFTRVTGGAGALPTNVEEVVSLQEADTRRLEALARLDTYGETYKWVNAVRALQRPVVVAAVMATYVGVRFSLDVMPEDLTAYASAITFYLFGDRANYHAQRALRGGQ
jgi:hypothetical protein